MTLFFLELPDDHNGDAMYIKASDIQAVTPHPTSKNGSAILVNSYGQPQWLYSKASPAEVMETFRAKVAESLEGSLTPAQIVEHFSRAHRGGN